MNCRVHGLQQRLTLAIRAQTEVFTPAMGSRVVVLDPQQLNPSSCISYTLLLQLGWCQKATPRGGWWPAVDICTVLGNVLLRACFRVDFGDILLAKLYYNWGDISGLGLNGGCRGVAVCWEIKEWP
jgi:hypothetical protein